MLIYNERPIVKVNRGLLADSFFIFLSLMMWAAVLIGFNFFLYWIVS